MTSEDPVLTELAEANPVPRTTKPAAYDGAEADRILKRVLSTPPSRSRRRWPILVPIASVVVVIVVVVAAVNLHGSGPGDSGTVPSSGLRIVLQAEPTPQQPVVTRAAISREVQIIRERLRSILHSFSVTAPGANQLVISAGDISSVGRARIVDLVTAPGRLYLYDWEANALAPNSKTVAGELQAQDPTALTISQGTDRAAPGEPGAGALPLYEAVKLATKQPKTISPDNGRPGLQYYVFGVPGSSACRAAAKEQGMHLTPGQPCLLAGPDNEPYSRPREQVLRDLAAQLPPGKVGAEVLVVQQGTVVLQAENPRPGQQIKFSSPAARFFVLRDHTALRGSDITNPQQSTDSGANPAVTFGFKSAGQKEFQSVTAAIARRGQDLSTLGQTLNQHFAIALDDQLLTVPSIDFKLYPDGVTGAKGADIAGSLTKQSAKDIATALRYGPLPLQLRLIRG